VGDFDWNPEIEIATMNTGQANLFASRMVIPASFQRIGLDVTHADIATDLLLKLNLRAILYTGTSPSYVFGLKREKEFKDRLEVRTKGIPIVIPAMALADAAQTFGVRRIALVHPPWFMDETNELGRKYFQGRGFDVVSARPIEPRRNFSEVPAAEVYRWIMATTPPQAEAVVVGGGGLRIIGAIEALERSLGRPVITANQATFWQGLKLAGARGSVSGYGRLFAS
jgi:maleate isomerase